MARPCSGRLDGTATRRPANPLVVGGEARIDVAADILADQATGRGLVIASEICGTWITSQGPSLSRMRTFARANPHLRFADGEARGHVATTLTDTAAHAELRAVDTVKRQDAGIRMAARFDVEAGRPGVHVRQA